MNKTELNKLINYLEENTRADKVSGIEFIDPRNFKEKVSLASHVSLFLLQKKPLLPPK
jgi:hypothetical protein